MRHLFCFFTILFGVFLTAGSAVASPVDLITNGGFESGFTAWTDTTTLSSPYCAWAIDNCLFYGPASDGGAHYASNGFDGSGPGTYTLAQTVAIPSGTATLSWEEAFWTSYFGAPRTAEVKILDAAGTTTLGTVYSYTPPSNLFSAAWVQHSVDLSAYAGQTVQVAFVQTIPEYFTGPAGMGIDNVQLVADPVAGSRLGYCSAPGDTWQNGTAIPPGTFLDLLAGQPDTDANYAGATVARMVEGVGITCDAPPAGYSIHGAGGPYPDFGP